MSASRIAHTFLGSPRTKFPSQICWRSHNITPLSRLPTILAERSKNTITNRNVHLKLVTRAPPKQSFSMIAKYQSGPEPTPDFSESSSSEGLNILHAHPHLYPNNGNSMVRTEGLRIGSGWYPLINRLSAQLEAMIIALPNPSGAYAVQVKEKFGGLRFYTHGMTEEMHELIEEAEEESVRTCESCGKPGVLCATTSEWYLTACEDEECRHGGVPLPPGEGDENE